MFWRSTGKRGCPSMEACVSFSTFILHPCREDSLTMLLLRKRIKKKKSKRKKKRLRWKKVDRERRAGELYRPELCPYSEVKLKARSHCACVNVDIISMLWLIYIAGGELGYGLGFRSHSCSWQLGLESESDSMQSNNFCIVQCSHWVWSPNLMSLIPSLNPAVLISH